MSRGLTFDATGTPVGERGVLLYQADLKKETGAAVVAADFSTLVITVYNVADKALINGLDGTSILNDGVRGTIDALGHLTVTLSGLDLPIVVAGTKNEDHEMLIEGTYGGKKTYRVVRHRVVNLEHTP